MSKPSLQPRPGPRRAPAAATLVAALAALALSGCPGVGQVLRLYGYTELRPPSLLLAPGTMVWVKQKRPFMAGVVCTQAASLGPRFVPSSSPTAGADLSRATNQDFSLDGEYLGLLQAGGRFSSVGSIQVRLENATVFEVNDVDVLGHSAQRSAACREAIALRRNAGYAVTMVAAALQADVTYTVQFKREARLGGGNKTDVLQELALALGIERAHVGEHTISALALMWGIRDETYLARISEPRALHEVVAGGRALGAATLPVFVGAPDVDVDDPLAASEAATSASDERPAQRLRR